MTDSIQIQQASAGNVAPDTQTNTALRSVHTINLPQLLSFLRASVLVSTYQAGKLVVLRNDNGVLNTHFRSFAKPMGVAYSGGRLAIGGAVDIWEYHNVPAVCSKINTPVRSLDRDEKASVSIASQPTRPIHDACFLPRRSHTTGDIQIHEMAWTNEGLWFVNTAFSCLATRSDEYSFTPQWRPPFLHSLTPGDCCHLNGIAVRDGRVRYVTALGETSSPSGWRNNKRNGGILMDVDSGEILVRGLSMPHSPRWHNNQLWLLESGDGTLGTVDLNSGRYEAIAQMPGFTRGLSFLGPYAFVGLSQVRESAVFSGIPLVERLKERACGVWIVDTRSGQVAAYVKFEDAVQEVFAVESISGIQYPDIINYDIELVGRSYVLADGALAEVPEYLRS